MVVWVIDAPSTLPWQKRCALQVFIRQTQVQTVLHCQGCAGIVQHIHLCGLMQPIQKVCVTQSQVRRGSVLYPGLCPSASSCPLCELVAHAVPKTSVDPVLRVLGPGVALAGCHVLMSASTTASLHATSAACCRSMPAGNQQLCIKRLVAAEVYTLVSKWSCATAVHRVLRGLIHLAGVGISCIHVRCVKRFHLPACFSSCYEWLHVREGFYQLCILHFPDLWTVLRCMLTVFV
jgi:hypothetical protein